MRGRSPLTADAARRARATRDAAPRAAGPRRRRVPRSRSSPPSALGSLLRALLARCFRSGRPRGLVQLQQPLASSVARRWPQAPLARDASRISLRCRILPRAPLAAGRERCSLATRVEPPPCPNPPPGASPPAARRSVNLSGCATRGGRVGEGRR